MQQKTREYSLKYLLHLKGHVFFYSRFTVICFIEWLQCNIEALEQNAFSVERLVCITNNEIALVRASQTKRKNQAYKEKHVSAENKEGKEREANVECDLWWFSSME